MKYPGFKNGFSLIVFLFFTISVKAQITADADATIPTNYSSGTQDNIYIFCTSEGESVAGLTASFSSNAAADYEWLKYNSSTQSFDAFSTDNSEATSSTINNLEDGAYRVNVTSGGNTETYTAWVFNNWYTPVAEIPVTNCDYFQLGGSFTEADLTYYDLSNGNQLSVMKNVQVRWEDGGSTISTILSPSIFSPPTTNTDYRLVVYDRFGCEGETSITYSSIVTKAKFSVDPSQFSFPSEYKDEAPLEVTFTNESENADRFEWFFFRDLLDIKREAEQTGGIVEDSIMARNNLDENPVYVYENSGTYQVKLVTTKQSEFNTCTDTFYFENYIIADTSFIDAPNVFTPGNGDLANNEFIIKYWSVKDIKINIFNRWGKKVHEWKKSNVQGFENTAFESAWDGKIGGRYASPGVYYYVVEATGRDDRKRWAHGFVHLFREK